MSCNKCDLHNNGFKSEDEFVIFQELIASLVKAGQLMELERKLDARFFDVRYQCNFCQTFWR